MLDSGPGRSHARRRPEVAPWDGSLQLPKTRTKDVILRVARTGRVGEPLLGHRMNGCLLGVYWALTGGREGGLASRLVTRLHSEFDRRRGVDRNRKNNQYLWFSVNSNRPSLPAHYGRHTDSPHRSLQSQHQRIARRFRFAQRHRQLPLQRRRSGPPRPPRTRKAER